MIRRSLEWFAGSVIVYILTAACAAGGGIEGMMQMATGGIASMVGGNSATGAQGADGNGATSSGAQGSDGSGALGADGEGATGGTSIIDPVPDADAAEDGTRIVNMYMTTADGLKVPQGFYDTELGTQCWFQIASDGRSRCLPSESIASVLSNYFIDAACSQRAAIASKGPCSPEAATESIAADGTCGSVARIVRYAIGTKAASLFVLSGETCTANTTLLETYDAYALGAEIQPTTYAEGTLVQGGQ